MAACLLVLLSDWFATPLTHAGCSSTSVAPGSMAKLCLALCAFAALVAEVRLEETSPEDEATDDLTQFRDWYTSLNPANKRAEVRDTGNWGLGVYATADIKKGETILKIPKKWVVSHEGITQRARSLRATDKTAALEFKLYSSLDNQNDALIAWLLIETVHKGDNSEWAVWLRVLPKEFHAPLQFSPAEMRLIQPVRVREEVENLRGDAATRYAKLKKQMWFDFTLDNWKWAKSILSTRAWHMQGVETLVPVAGMFNHNPDDDDARFDYRTAGKTRSQKFLRYHTLSSGVAHVMSDRAVSAGDQVFESYGDNPSSIYFLYHGFVPAANPYDCYKFALADPSGLPITPPEGISLQPLNSKRVELLKKGNIQRHVCLHRDEVSREAMFFYGVASVDEKTWKKCSKNKDIRNLTPNKKSYRRFHQCTKKRNDALRVYVKVLNYELKSQFTGTQEEDERLLEELSKEGGSKTLPATSGARTALQYRINQRSLLLSAVDAVEKMLPQHERTPDLAHEHDEEL
eukprot:TRINITY_DN17890_c0_g1_i1.p1 TRINITY_DN17890_c0_g1~~TRINITY_DN17890_c0_g1_i1.p1  ORF type:complete len:540 (+),score=199.31 TRINITY_DN17890_c0_g1_i1:71-1621(+)